MTDNKHYGAADVTYSLGLKFFRKLKKPNLHKDYRVYMHIGTKFEITKVITVEEEKNIFLANYLVNRSSTDKKVIKRILSKTIPFDDKPIVDIEVPLSFLLEEQCKRIPMRKIPLLLNKASDLEKYVMMKRLELNK